MNLLTYKDKQYYTENSIILAENSIEKNMFTLFQIIRYDDPEWNDEEFGLTLTLFFIDTSAAKIRKKLNLGTDTTIVKCTYEESCMLCDLGSEKAKKNKVSGQIEITKWSKNSVTIKEDILIYDSKKKLKQTFVGTRTFTKKKNR